MTDIFTYSSHVIQSVLNNCSDEPLHYDLTCHLEIHTHTPHTTQTHIQPPIQWQQVCNFKKSNVYFIIMHTDYRLEASFCQRPKEGLSSWGVSMILFASGEVMHGSGECLICADMLQLYLSRFLNSVTWVIC